MDDFSRYGPPGRRPRWKRDVVTHTLDQDTVARVLPLDVVKPVLIEEFRKGGHQPPLLPDVAQRAVAISRRPDADFRECEAVLQEDPVLVAELVKVANSPLYRGRHETRTLKGAIGRVGFKGLRDILLAASARRLLRIRGDADLTDWLQERSMAVAMAARSVAAAAGFSEDAAYLGGLVHDVGWSVVYGLYAAARRRLPEDFTSSPDAMRKVARALHGTFGGMMARMWKLPEAVVQAIARHHKPDRAKSQEALTFVIAAAVRLCDHLGIHPEGKPIDPHRDQIFKKLRLLGPRLDEVMVDFQIAWGGKEAESG